MGLDFKSALLRLRRQGPVAFPADALLWLLQTIRHAHFQTTSESAAGPQEMAAQAARQMAEHLGHQARRQFGDIAPAIFKSWGLESGADLFRALEVLARMEAVQFSPGETQADYALIAALLPETQEREQPHA